MTATAATAPPAAFADYVRLRPDYGYQALSQIFFINERSGPLNTTQACSRTGTFYIASSIARMAGSASDKAIRPPCPAPAYSARRADVTASRVTLIAISKPPVPSKRIFHLRFLTVRLDLVGLPRHIIHPDEETRIAPPPSEIMPLDANLLAVSARNIAVTIWLIGASRVSINPTHSYATY